MNKDDAAFWMAIRQGLLMLVDAIEKLIGVKETTADLRKMRKRGE